MRILSVNIPQHDASVSLIDDYEILACYEEERHTRVKSYKKFHDNLTVFPFLSMIELKSQFDLSNIKIDYLATTSDGMIDFIKSQYGVDIDQSKLFKVDHHQAHAALAYYWSNFNEDSLVLVLDAGANNEFTGRWYLGNNGKLTEIGNLNYDHLSYGTFYMLLTEFLGFKRLKDEGKVVGMSSHGTYDEGIYNLFKEYLTLDENLKTPKLDLHTFFRDFYKKWFDIFGGSFWKNKLNDVAFNGQLAFEDTLVELVNGIKEKHPEIKKVCLSGGVFANIKVNKRINDLDWVEEVFISPPMGDEGLSIGSSLVLRSEIEPNFRPYELKNVFFGTSVKETEIFNIDIDKFEIKDYTPEKIAEEIALGKVIGFIQGKYEHGPRALGARSILAHPGLKSTYNKVNDRLKRNDFMPFAPSVLSEKAEEIFDCQKSKYTGEFMTMLYNTKEEWKSRIPAVVHPIDGTARAQIVVRHKNPRFWEIINEFYKKTGIPLLLNTSFNTHGEPIVRTLEDGLKHLESGIVDILVVENKIILKK